MTEAPVVLTPKEITDIAQEAADNYNSPHRCWLLGDTSLKMAPWGTGRLEAERLLQPLADEVGVSTATLDSYRRVSQAWPEEKRDPGTAFSVYMILYHPRYQSLYAAGMTTTQANKAKARVKRAVNSEQAELEREAKARAQNRIQSMVTQKWVGPTPALTAAPEPKPPTEVVVQLPPLVVEEPEPAPTVKPLAERVFDVAQRIEEAMIDGGPDHEAAILADAVIDVLDADMGEVAQVAQQLQSRVRWAATRRP